MARTAPLRPDVVLANRELTAKFASRAGYMLVWLSSAAAPGVNLINAYDHGRGVQQSVYGDPDGSLWNFHPWMENWVQGGDWRGKSPEIVDRVVASGSLRSVTRGIHWASGADGPVLFTQRAVLAGPVLRITYAMDYQGDSNVQRDQEYPAVFANPKLSSFVTHEGVRTVGDLSAGNSYGPLPGGFCAWLNPRGNGLGIASSKADRYTAYTVAGPAGCSYVAPIRTVGLVPGQSSYEVRLAVGTLERLKVLLA